MPKLPPIPSPMKPVAVSIVVERLRIIVPAAVLFVVVLALSPGLVLLLMPQRAALATAPNAAAQEWTTDASALRAASVVLGALPPPDPRQRKAPCDPDLEADVGGYCWIGLDVKPPCPRGKAWEHNGKCYAYALKAAGVPTSGEPQRASIAGP